MVACVEGEPPCKTECNMPVKEGSGISDVPQRLATKNSKNVEAMDRSVNDRPGRL